MVSLCVKKWPTCQPPFCAMALFTSFSITKSIALSMSICSSNTPHMSIFFIMTSVSVGCREHEAWLTKHALDAVAQTPAFLCSHMSSYNALSMALIINTASEKEGVIKPLFPLNAREPCSKRATTTKAESVQTSVSVPADPDCHVLTNSCSTHTSCETRRLRRPQKGQWTHRQR